MTNWDEVRHRVAVFGRVFELETNKPIGGVKLRIIDGPITFTDWLTLRAIRYGYHWKDMIERPDQTITSSDGHFHFIDLPDGQYKLSASLPGSSSRYGESTILITVSRGADGNIAGNAADIFLSPTGIKGKITDNDGEPLAMAKVQVRGSGEKAFSDSRGLYCMLGLETGERGIVVNARGYKQGFQRVLLKQRGSLVPLNFVLQPS